MENKANSSRSKIDYEKWLKKENLEILEGWVRAGLNQQEIASNMGMSLASLLKFREREPEIKKVMTYSKNIADTIVENALFKKCTGFKVTLSEAKMNAKGEVVKLSKEVYYPPDIQAIIFYLTNKKADIWQNRKSMETKVEIEDDGFINAMQKSVKELYKDENNINEVKKLVEE